MAISPSIITSYAPWGNAQLMFEVGSAVESVDPATGNTVTGKEVLSYLASVQLQTPNWKAEPGVDSTTYQCQGRLLSPTVLDPRITNGATASAIINGYRGRFELVINLRMKRLAYKDIRQEIQGIFRVIGGAL